MLQSCHVLDGKEGAGTARGKCVPSMKEGSGPRSRQGRWSVKQLPGAEPAMTFTKRWLEFESIIAKKKGTLQQQRDTKRALGFMKKAHDSAVDAMKAQESKGGRLNLQSRDAGSTAGGTFGSASSATSSCGV